MVRPPRLGKHQGARVASTSRAGSQTPSERPMRGIGEPQRQIGDPGFGVSNTPETLPMVIGPIEIGNRHSQQTSEIGLTNRPVQDCAEAAPDHSTAARSEHGRKGGAADHAAGPPASGVSPAWPPGSGNGAGSPRSGLARRSDRIFTMPCHPEATISVTVRSLPSLSVKPRVAIRPSTITRSPLRSIFSTAATVGP